MTIIVDANIVIAVLDPEHPFHRAALRRCLAEDRVLVLNITRAEALIHPTRFGRSDAVDAELDRLGFETCVLDNDVADRARQLRATYGNKNLPMVDAAVVALGVELGCPVVTADAKWPEIPEAGIETISLDR